MKIFGLFLPILLISVCSCVQNKKRPTPNFYKNLYTNEVINTSEFKELGIKIIQENFDSIPQDLHISYHFESLEFANDSIIQPFKYDLRVGSEYIIRAMSYEKVGMKVLPHTFLTINGDSIKVGGVQLKPTLVNLWFIGCPGCVAEIPALNRLQEKYKDKVNFIAMTFENEKDVLKFLGRRDFKFKHIVNAQEFINYIGTKPYPENIFIGRNGEITNIEEVLGDGEDLDVTIKHFEEILERLLCNDQKKQVLRN
ncbi:TlpA family protein disulfide reductase [Carboxylicivirga mesophila]|uniref:TlpA family protein disulfide reductase n=1 Tax=Carboxylicivirga mesophila TaxID=1166478 RepID=A0ABS5K4L3_9BACT|nr:TlpA disulfide reductase family protein [Carboxylicivirga mesophila]MBS2209949.1 TlpA family protein disulfide reductase [Carboxylicivirga mesophila]